MEKWALSGSAKQKLRKEKEAKDAALVQQIPSISTFFTRKVRQDDGTHSSGASTTTHQDDLQDANTASLQIFHQIRRTECASIEMSLNKT